MWDPLGSVHRQVFYENFDEAVYSGCAGGAVRLYQSKIIKRIPLIPRGTYLELGSHSLELTERVFKRLGSVSAQFIAVDIAYPNSTGISRRTQLENTYPFQTLSLVQSDVAQVPLDSETVDVVFHGCLLHHLERPLKSLNEIRRITRDQGTIIYYLPCDPGLLLRVIQRLISQRVAKRVMSRRKLSVKFLWSIEHRNHFSSLREMIHHVHLHDDIKSFRYPLPWKFWNFNLFEVIMITRNNEQTVNAGGSAVVD